MKTIHLISNTRSGRGGGQQISEIAEKLCAEHGARLIVYPVSQPEELAQRAYEAVQSSSSHDDVVVAAGGDGTLRTVAEIVRGSVAAYGAIPCGTFNYFARAHKLPVDPQQALKLILTGVVHNVRLGEINGRIFLINASLGLYAKAIDEREASRKIFGRFRLVSVLSTAKTLLRKHKNLRVLLKSDDGEKRLKTPMIFIGNNALQLRGLSLSVADCFEKQQLAVVTLKPIRGLEMFRVLTRGILKTLEHEERLEQFCISSLTIETHQLHQKVALDGEMFDMTSPFEVRAAVGELAMIK